MVLTLWCTVKTVTAQSFAINTDGSIADPSALLDIKSSTKGILIPRLSTTQRNAIPAPAKGLMVFDSTTNGFWYHNGLGWINLVNSSDTYWSKIGSHIYNTNSVNVGMGTPFPLAKLHVAEANVLFNASFGPALVSPGPVPVSSTGRRMFWYVDKAAFRSGYVTNTYWDKDSIGNYSFAAGHDVIAKGQYAVSMGWNNNASGEAAVSLGLYNVSSGGFGAMSAGFGNTASGTSAIALGGSNIAGGAYSIALGFQNTTSNSSSLAGINNSTASGQYAVALGNSVIASGLSSMATGESNTSSGSRSFSANYLNLASGFGATAFGMSNLAKAMNGFVIGTFNDDSDSPNPNAENPTDRIFQVGNGIFNFGSPIRTNALTILRNGNVGINSSNPSAPLELGGSVFGKKITLLPVNPTNECGFGIQPNLMQLYTTSNTYDMAFGFGSSASFTENIRFTGTGRIGIGTSTPNAPLQFSNSTVNRKLVLYDQNNNDHQYYGFGINGGTLRYQTDAAGADHVFFSGINSSSSKELMRIKGNGAVGVGISNPSFVLEINGRSKIHSGGNNGNSAGIWLNNNANTVAAGFIGMENDNSLGFYGTGTPNGWGLVMEISTGNVGIGTSSPTQKLHVMGNILASGTITPSDMRHKKNIQSAATEWSYLSVKPGRFS